MSEESAFAARFEGHRRELQVHCYRAAPSAGMLLYTDGLTDARRGKQFFGLDGVAAALAELQHPSPIEAVDTLRARVAEFATDDLTDDLCLLAARFN